jgi:hypothetical protein
MRTVLTSREVKEALIRAGQSRAREFLWRGIALKTMDTLAAVATADAQTQ